MKNIINAIIEFKTAWPDDATHLCTTADNWEGLPIYAGTIQPVINRYNGYYDGVHSLKIGAGWWQVLCSEAEFKAAVTAYFQKYKAVCFPPFTPEQFLKWLATEYLGSYRELEPVTVSCGQASGGTGAGKLAVNKAYGEEHKKSWFEKGEFPPVDIECIYTSKNGVDRNIYLTAIGTFHFLYKNKKSDTKEYVGDLYSKCFKPLEAELTEEEKIIKAAFESLTIDNSDLAYKICQDLYHNGFLNQK